MDLVRNTDVEPEENAVDVGGVRAGVFTQRFICCVKLDFVAQHDQGPFEEGGIRAHLRRCGKRDMRS